MAAKRKIPERTHRNPTLGAGVGSLGKATYGRDYFGGIPTSWGRTLVHTESVTEIAIRAVLLPRSLIAVTWICSRFVSLKSDSLGVAHDVLTSGLGKEQ